MGIFVSFTVQWVVFATSLKVLILQPGDSGPYTDYRGLICRALESFSTCVEVTVNNREDCLQQIKAQTPLVVMDLTGSPSLAIFLSNLTNEYEFLHVETLTGEEIRGNRTFGLWPERSFQANLMSEILRYFGWTKAALVGSSDVLSLHVSNTLHSVTTDLMSYVFSTDSSDSVAIIENALSVGIKSSGRNIIIVAIDQKYTELVLQAAKNKSMMEAGYVYFIMFDSVPDSLWIQENEGLFYVSPTCDASVESRQSMFLRQLITLLNVTEDRLEESLRTVTRFPSLCLFNVQQNASVLFAQSLGLNVSLTEAQLVFSGPTATPPGSILPVLLSISNSLNNPTIGPSTDAATLPIDSELAITDANTNLGLIPNFELTWNGLEYGYFEFNSTWALSHLSPTFPYLGAAIIGSPASSTAIGLSSLLQNLNISKPLIGTINTASELSSPSAFPYYVRVDVPDSLTGGIYGQMIKFYGWKHCAVLYLLGDTWSEGLYQDFNKTAAILGIQIVNPVDQRGLDDSLDQTHYQSQVDAIVSTQVRIMVFIVYTSYIPTLINLMYDSGVRKGDVVFLAIEWLDQSLVTNSSDPNLGKFQELLQGSIMSLPLAFRGAFGAMVYSEMAALDYGPPQGDDCICYDASLLAVYSLQYLLARGFNYKDPNVMITELRSAKFVGCSGLVYIEKGSNDRAYMAFEILNMQYYLENNTWAFPQVMIFDPESQQMFQRIASIQWPDGTSITPTDMIPETTCPDERHLGTFTEGEYLEVAVCTCVLILVSVMAFFIWKRWWRLKYPTLVSRQEISMEDYFMFLGMAIEFFQVLGMGPDIQELTHLVVYASEASSLNFNSLVYLQKGAFWIMLDCIFIACLVWMLMLVATYSGVFERLHLSTLESMSDRWLPFIGDYCFLPIVSVLLDVFLCDRAYSNSFTSSVLSKDCYFKCWGTTHVLYVTGSAVLLLLWVPAAVFTRPLWQELNNVLHVKTQPEHLLIATIFQITLIVFNKTVKRSQAVVHMILYMLMVGGMAAKMCWRQPHNYARATMWHVTMYVAALWMGIISIISYFFNAPFGVEVALFAGWGGIAAIGLFLQTIKYKSLLYRKPRKDTRELFRFAFKFSSTESQANIDFNRPNTVREVVKSSEMNAHEFTLSRVEQDPSIFNKVLDCE